MNLGLHLCSRLPRNQLAQKFANINAELSTVEIVDEVDDMDLELPATVSTIANCGGMAGFIHDDVSRVDAWF
jgi:hypothetical protein